MATVVLTAVGSLLGGPIGGAIGAALGQRIDTAVLGPGKGREGPRLKELQVQTSSYGTQIPAVFGAMRIAGTVIWSTDLIERRVKSGGGKGRPSSVNYSYSVSFAVALSSRPLARIGRIWVDGNLLRGAAGDFKVETQFRFHDGHSDQTLDPLLASAEAAGQCPAHRGLAYVVFEDLPLADFGNRIPSLTFEVFERDGPVPVADIVRATSQGLVDGNAATALGGFAIQGRDFRSALDPLLTALPISVRPVEDSFLLSDWSSPTETIVVGDAAISDGGTRLDPPGLVRGTDSGVPGSVAVRHYDPARDFQAGIQTSRQIGSARADLQIDLPASLTADVAKGFAELQLLQLWRGLNSRSLTLPVAAYSVHAGIELLDQHISGAYRIAEIEHFRGATRIIAHAWNAQAFDAISADPGRNQADPDVSVGTTRLMLLELPAMGSTDSGRPTVVVAAAGTSAGWRRASLSVRDGERRIELGATSGAAMMGHLVNDLPLHTPLLADHANQPIIRLLHEGMELPPGTGDPASFDAPVIWVNGEILRYGRADKVGQRDYRLQDLIRDCYGDVGEMVEHAAGSECLLLEKDQLLLLDTLPVYLGSVVEMDALGVGDAEPVEKMLTIDGNAIRPRRPVHGVIERQPNGDILLHWIRRDRLAYVWTDGVDIPNSEGDLECSVELSVAGTPIANWTVSTESLLIANAEISALSLSAGASLDFLVRQQGRYALSAPLLLQLGL